MKRTRSIVFMLLVAVLPGCAYFHPPPEREVRRLQEEETIRQDEYLKGSFLDGLVQAAGSCLNR